MGASISTTRQPPRMAPTSSAADAVKKLSPLPNDERFASNKENFANAMDFRHADHVSDDEDDNAYFTTCEVSTGTVLKQRNATISNLVVSRSVKQLPTEENSELEIDICSPHQLSCLTEEEQSPMKDLSEFSVISLGDTKMQPVEVLNFDSPPVSGKPTNAHGSPVSVHGTYTFNGSSVTTTPTTITTITSTAVTTPDNAKQKNDTNSQLPQSQSPAATVAELVYGFTSPKSPEWDDGPVLEADRSTTHSPNGIEAARRNVFSVVREVSERSTNEQHEKLNDDTINTVRKEVQASVKRSISKRLHETHAALDEVLCDAVQAFEKANKEADRVLAAVSTAKSSAREVAKVHKVLDYNNKIITQSGMPEKTLYTRASSDMTQLSTGPYPNSTLTNSMPNVVKNFKPTPIMGQHLCSPVIPLPSSSTSSVNNDVTNTASTKTTEKRQYLRRKPPVFPRPSTQTKQVQQQDEESHEKSPSPTNVQDFPKKLHSDRPIEHLGAGTRPRIAEPPQDEALSSAGETDVEDPDTAEPKALLFLVDKQQEVARTQSLSVSATRPHVTPTRDSTWPMKPNRHSIDVETWDIAPASIREVGTQVVEVESIQLQPNSRFSDKESPFGFFPEQLRTDSNKDDQWDSYLPETLMGNQFAEMGTRSRARPPLGRRRLRTPWAGSRTKEHELDSRPWDGNRPRRVKTEGGLRQHDSFYSTDMTEPTTMEIITAIAPIKDEDKPRRRRKIRFRKRRTSKVEQTVAEWMQKPMPIQLPKWPRELRRIHSHI